MTAKLQTAATKKNLQKSEKTLKTFENNAITSQELSVMEFIRNGKREITSKK